MFEINKTTSKKIKLLYEKYERVIEENEKLRKKLKKKSKGKIIQTITAWWYPCYGKKVFYYRPETYEIDFLNILPITNTKKQLILLQPNCCCGKGCKPEKVKIIVMKGENDERS